MEESDISERSLLNASPDTIQAAKDDAAFYKSRVERTTYAPPPAYTENILPDRPQRKRERVAFRLDSWADWIWDTAANILQPRSTGEGWTAETCSFVFAILSLLGLVVTLFLHQNKPLPQWPQLITINSIVSLFSLLMRAGVGLVLAEGISQCKWQWFRKPRKLKEMDRFDAASRSAWGSVGLLVHVKLERLSCVVALGALITIWAALTGFFLQQLMVFHDCQQQDHSAIVRVSKTNNCRVSYWGALELNYDPDPPMIAAINSAMVQSVPDYTNVFSSGCVSGNCTFPSDQGAALSTVAVDYTCDAIAGRIQNITRPDGMYNLSLPIGDDTSIELCPRCDNPPIAMATGTGMTSYNDSKSLATIYILSTSYNISDFRNNSNTREDGWQAIECSLYPMMKTYAVDFKDSVMTESLIDSIRLPSNPLGDVGRNETYAEYQRLAYSHRLITNRTLRDGTWQGCTNLTGFQEDVVQVNTGPDTTGFYYQDCIYSFSRALAGGVSLYFAELFDNQKLYWGVNEDIDMDYWRNHTLEEHPPPKKIGPPHLRQMYSYGDFIIDTARKIFEGVAGAMTTIVRTHYSDGPDTDAKGIMLVTTTCIRIDWRWLWFPVAMIGLTGIFLALVIIESREVPRERLWKSSVLASLFCEVDRGEEDDARLDSKRSMHDVAKSASVNLDGKGGTLRLVAR
ncbi:hypothetical protein E8E11_007451 [Didymella keratinophila]|nr:hypothetical protein E8E11_007451 [Didymella keratinophila]